MGTGKVELYVIFFFFTILICNDGSRLLLFYVETRQHQLVYSDVHRGI